MTEHFRRIGPRSTGHQAGPLFHRVRHASATPPGAERISATVCLGATAVDGFTTRKGDTRYGVPVSDGPAADGTSTGPLQVAPSGASRAAFISRPTRRQPKSSVT